MQSAYHILYLQSLQETFKSNEIFHYTHCLTPKRVTSLKCLSPHHCAYEQHRSFQRNVTVVGKSGNPLATLCPIRQAQDLNLRPSGIVKNGDTRGGIL